MWRKWIEMGFLSNGHVCFAETFGRLAKVSEHEKLAFALVCRAVEQGSSCFDLARLPTQWDVHGESHNLSWPNPRDWLNCLKKSGLVAMPDGQSPKPFFFDGESRLYMWRYWEYEQQFTQFLNARIKMPKTEIDAEVRAQILRFFPADLFDEHQRDAAFVSVRSPLAIITGGPGTGKTTVVTRLLLLYIQRALAGGRSLPRMALLAPTGKAASRLMSSIQSQVKLLPKDLVGLAQYLPNETSTIHRLLGYQPFAPTEFRHNATNPLSFDLVIVDECSMVDLPLMTKLTQSLRSETRLILLGDHHQLSSIEVGSVLGDLVEDEHLSRDWLSRAEPNLNNHVVVLKTSYRIDASSQLGRLTHAIRGGLKEKCEQLLTTCDDIELFGSAINSRDFENWIMEHFGDLGGDDPMDLLARQSECRLLCAHRYGRFGSLALNTLIESLLMEKGLVKTGAKWYSGRPVIMTQNHQQLDLFNGDMGVVFRQADGASRVGFLGSDGLLRSFNPIQLPACETAYALTIHKSQGSEWRHVGLVFPDWVSPIMTRELVYTGLTRAQEKVSIFGSVPTILAAIDRRVERASGLRTQFRRGQSVTEPTSQQLELFE
ncbi:MAG: exodeoxyribonuclease V subunit alpha [Acidobacteria bacterium]|nr:exodeoxyribonuclease V subunit alpha [Acidobacteriota bacterium]